MTTRRNTNKAESESTRVTVISGVDQRGALHSTCKSEKVTEGIMTSLRYLTCLFLLTVSLTDLSKAGCRDQFTKNAWKKNLTNRLPDYIPIQMDRKPEEVMECSIKNTDAEPTLEDCFEDTDVCKGKSNSSTSVAFYHLMCLTDIAMNLTENEESKTIAAGVCKVYEKVCEPFLQSSSTPDKNIGACATNETDIFKLQIVIAFLIFTNVLGPLAVYMYMRRQRNRESFNDVNRNMPDTVQMTIQPQTLDQIEDSGEGAVLLKTSQCSVIINPPETTQTEKRQNGLGH
ncbi:uncharacterized protein LOC115784866 isoform X7 [Archocentrus centrarchus]|uniref:uncharacterized protein LOC115784866 isoform X7 n=1 Tax=Archocentrus centrarchus TaxID=63155 RepID=UPI0011EA3531|nr:uncharacterized protein LOC115784866 isoform X7 [Archocentrus centrarchus]